MLTIVFYSNNGAAAKQRAREIAAASKGDYARCYDVGAWDNTLDKCDVVEVMPDVPGWQRDRITKVYGQIDEVKESETPDDDSLARKPMGLMPAKPELENPVKAEKKAVHRGGGRWFVMSGEEIISGPHDKAEASKLAGETS